MKKLILFSLILMISISLIAQERVAGHLIVWHHENVRGDVRAAFMSRYSAQELAEEEVLAHELNIILYTFNHRAFDEDEMLETIRQDESVYLAQFNPYMTLRHNEPFIPNDPNFNVQWHLRNTGQSSGVVGADISATQAWAEVLAFENKNQREIVVAVPDGMNASSIHHTDINWFRNESGHCHTHGLDCPNTQLCDYWGWNAGTNQPLAQSPPGTSQHGLAVSGIVGAIVDNDLRVASIGGLNIKILPIHMNLAGGAAVNSSAINAYNFILQKRLVYNETGGQYGAYIVATNASWGVDNAWPHTYPVWAGMYDLMGEQGIISTQAPPNGNVNIDNVGDMPGTVTSPWSITITNMNRNDVKVQQAAFGPIHVHLGAPGQNITTTTSNNGAGDAGGGTSYAAPQVAGTVGLMYQVASEELLSAFDDNPGDLALLFRQFILDGVDPNNNIANNTVTGGRLNALNPVLDVLALNEEYIIDPDDKTPFTIFDFEGDTIVPSLGDGTISLVGGTTSSFVVGWIGTGTGGRALNTTSYPAQGTAPETAGIMVQVPTAGFLNIHLSWNNINSNTGANRTRLQYTIDGSTWINFDADETNATNIRYISNNPENTIDMGFDNGLFITLENNWYQRTADLSAISEINNNPDFAVRFVTAFPSGSDQYGGTGGNYGTGGTIRYDNLTFYYTETGELEFVSSPIATPEGGTYLTPISVSLETETVAASIYFTTDGSNPSVENGTLYTAPIPISVSTTLRFRGEKEGMLPSATITETYIIPVQISSLLELRSQTPGSGEIFHITSEVIVSMTQPNFRNQIYIQDDNAGILIDDNTNVINPTYNIGDGVTGLTGQINVFNGMLQFVPSINSGNVTSTANEIIPVETTFAVLNSNLETYQARLVKVDGVLFQTEGNFVNFTDYPVSDATADYTFRTNFNETDYEGDPIPTGPVNITGIISTRITGSHIAARFASEIELIELDVSTPVINPAGGYFVDPITISITCETENVSIYFTLDGSEPDENSTFYTEPFELSETAIVKAIAFDAFGNNSYVKTENYVFYQIMPIVAMSYVVEGDTVTLAWYEPNYEVTSYKLQVTSIPTTSRSQLTTHHSRLTTHNLLLTPLIGYNVYRDYELLTAEPISDLFYIDEGLEKDREYRYDVSVVYIGGESEPYTYEVIVPMLNPPRNLRAYMNYLPKTDNNEYFYPVHLSWSTPETEHYASLLGYLIYVNGELYDTGSGYIEETIYELVKVYELGIHTFGVKAVYDLGESVADEIEFDVFGSEDNPIENPFITQLGGNYPNPFNPETTINFTLETAGNVSLEIFNIRGQRVRQLLSDFREKGHHQVIWNGTDDIGNPVGSGMYFYRMTTGDFSAVKRMVLMK